MELPDEFDLSAHEFAIANAPEGIGESFLDEPTAPELLEIGSGDDPTVEFRRTLGMFATGVTVITTRSADQVHGMTANAFMSVSLRPPLILISVDQRARMNALLHEGAHYGVSVLEEGQTALSDRFAGRPQDDAPELLFEIVHDTPLIEGALAQLVARVVRSYWGGDHSLFLGRVEYVRYGDGTPLLFHGGRYQRVVRDPHVFAVLSEELLGPILAGGAERSYADGDAIMRAGEPSQSLLFVLEGTVRIERPGKLAHISAGELLGEIEVLDGGRRIADAIAEGPVRCLEIARDDVVHALEADPAAAIALIGVLASRFREGQI